MTKKKTMQLTSLSRAEKISDQWSDLWNSHDHWYSVWEGSDENGDEIICHVRLIKKKSDLEQNNNLDGLKGQ
jgi:hypothetical protein